MTSSERPLFSLASGPPTLHPPLETAYYVHIVLALRLPGVTIGLYLRIFACYVQCLTAAGVSLPSSDVTKEIRISQGPQNY